MNPTTNRNLIVTALCANVLFLMLALLDYSLSASKYAWPIFVGWAFVILLMVILSVATFGVRVVRVAEPAAARVEAPTPKRKEAVVDFAEALVEKNGIPFTYNGYTLYGRDVELKNGGTRPIYYFAKKTPVSGAMVAKPAHMHVGVNERTGLPFLKKGDAADGEDLTPNIVAAYRPQCSALTAEGHQCRNSSRHESKYCASHFGYQPTVMPKAAAAREDTLPRVHAAPDTVPSVRKRST